MAKHFTFKSETQLGDCLLHAHFMRQVVEKVDKNTTFDYHLIPTHWDQVSEYTKSIPQITLKQYNDTPLRHLRGWIGQFGMPSLPCALDGLRLASYNALAEIKMGIESPFKTVDDLLHDHPGIYDYSLKCSEYDILLINSVGQSNQAQDFNEQDFIDFANNAIHKNKTVITTKKINGVDCTLDKGLSVMGIGGVSVKSKVIVGIGTGAIQCCLNIWNKDKRFLYIDQHHFFRRENIKIINSIKSIQI